MGIIISANDPFFPVLQVYLWEWQTPGGKIPCCQAYPGLKNSFAQKYRMCCFAAVCRSCITGVLPSANRQLSLLYLPDFLSPAIHPVPHNQRECPSAI